MLRWSPYAAHVYALFRMATSKAASMVGFGMEKSRANTRHRCAAPWQRLRRITREAFEHSATGITGIAAVGPWVCVESIFAQVVLTTV